MMYFPNVWGRGALFGHSGLEGTTTYHDNLYGQLMAEHIGITFDDGAVGMVEVGTCNYIPLPRFYIKGEYGTAIIDDWRNNMRVVRDKLTGPDKDQKPVETAAGLTKTMAPRTEATVETFEEERPASDVHDFYRNVSRAIDGTEPQLVTHGELMRVMRVMEAAFESDRLGGAPVTFEDTL